MDFPAAIMAPPSRGQRRVLLAICEHVAETGQVPTIRELCARLDISSPNGIMYHIRGLARKGWIVYIVAPGGVKTKVRKIVVPAFSAALREAARAFLHELRDSSD